MLRLKSCFLTVVFLLVAISFLDPHRASSNSNLVRLTKTPAENLSLNPSLSDDGRTVVFETSANFFSDGPSDSFHAIRADVRGDPVTFADLGSTRMVSPSLSRDGSTIAFASSEDLVGENSDRNSEIFIASGSGLRQITHTLKDGNFQASITSDGSLVAFTSGGNLFLGPTLVAEGTHPKLSGDGSRIYYQNGDDVFVLDVRTEIKRIIAADIVKLTIANGRAVSNDGMRFVYSAEVAANQSQVFLYDARDDVVRQLTQLGSRVTDVSLQPTISGDGKRVAFATRRRVTNTSDGSVELYVYDIPSGQIQQVTNAPTSATAEVVSSLNFDGSLVAFNFPRTLSETAADEFSNNSEIYLASLIPRAQFGTATVLNAASQSTSVASGSLATIRGSALAFKTESAPSVALPLLLAGTSVKVNGQPARILYASPDEVVVVVPNTDGPAEFVATNADGFASKTNATIARAAPGIFTANGNAIILDADTQTTGPFDPTNGRLRLSIFATGVSHAANVSATINGQTVKVETVVPSGLPGLDEIHVLVPAEMRGAGKSTLAVTAENSESNSVALNLGGSALRDVVINEFLADPPDGLAGDANHDGVRDSSADEFIEFVNSTNHDIDLSGYQLQTRALNATTDTLRHRFANGTILFRGTAIVVFGGGALNATNPIFGGAQVVKASSGGLSLVNSGGVITLRNKSSEIVTSVAYGTSLALRADQNQSLTRAPDVTGSFSQHSTVSDRAFSPGTQLDGAAFIRVSSISRSSVLSPSFSLPAENNNLKVELKTSALKQNTYSSIAAIASPANISHALASRGSQFPSLAFRFRRLPRRPT